MNILLPFSYEFFRNGFLAAGAIGALCGAIGVYVVLRKMSYIGHGLSHAVFAGAVISYVLQINFYLGAGVWGFLCALVIERISRRRRIGADAAIGIVTTASFALGVALISRVRQFTRNFDAALFGNVLGVTNNDLWVITIVGSICAIALFFLYKSLMFLTFDHNGAQAFRVRVGLIDTLFSLLLAATIIVSLQIMGVTLIAALLVIPPSTARLLTGNFHRLFALSILLGSLSSLVGMYLSFYLNMASGATIVIVASIIFAFAAITRRSSLAILDQGHDHEI